MIYPHYRKNSKNVPILSTLEISNIAEKYVFDYMPQVLETPQPFDIDGFLELYLGLSLDYQYLSHDGRYLGMTVFNDTDQVIVYNPKAVRAEYLSVNNGTIIIDNTLLDDNQIHRYRFTLGHETGHWIFHKAYFGYNPNQLSLFDTCTPFVQCREINSNYLFNKTDSWDETRWMEWQADKFASAVLLPETSVRIVFDNYKKSNGKIEVSELVNVVASTFNISKQAAYYRLCDLKIIEGNKSDFKDNQLSLI